MNDPDHDIAVQNTGPNGKKQDETKRYNIADM